MGRVDRQVIPVSPVAVACSVTSRGASLKMPPGAFEWSVQHQPEMRRRPGGSTARLVDEEASAGIVSRR
jgi:DNA-binding HxlR family transcriptional regulator